MTEYIDGLYHVTKWKSADILFNNTVSSGFGDSGNPLYSICVKEFYTQLNDWSDSAGIRTKYFTNPKLIAPINLIKWED